MGAVCRGGRTRGDYRAWDHALGVHEQYMPCGSVDADSAQLRITCGSSAKTRDGSVDALEAWWAMVEEAEQVAMTRLQSTRDHGPERRGMRTQFRHRMVQFAAQIGTPLHRLSSPPSPSKDNPIERGWGIWERHWHGTKWVAVETMLEWAKRMPWKGLHPVVELSRKV
jgi:hypothetical protein